jgi:hypothetical protein
VVSLALLPSRSLLTTCTAHARLPSTVHLQRQPTTGVREELDAAFQAAVAAGNWPAAAEHLNGFNDPRHRHPGRGPYPRPANLATGWSPWRVA